MQRRFLMELQTVTNSLTSMVILLSKNVLQFIILGLRTLFPMFMRTPSAAKKKDTTPDEHDEHVVSVKIFKLFGN
jgi:hypothetical protein